MSSDLAKIVDFTWNLTGLAEQIGPKLTVHTIIPSFNLIIKSGFKSELALIEQLYPLSWFLIDSGSHEGYSVILSSILPMLNDMLYDYNKKVWTNAIQSLVNLVELLKPDDRGDYILQFILKLAHEEDDV